MKQINFNTDKKALEHFRALGLVNITSDIQRRNGTKCFLDTKMSDYSGNAVMYTFNYSTGWIRRVTKRKWSCKDKYELLNRKVFDEKKRYVYRQRISQFKTQASIAAQSISTHRVKYRKYVKEPIQ